MAVTVDVSNASMQTSSPWTLWGQAIMAFSYESFRSWSLHNILVFFALVVPLSVTGCQLQRTASLLYFPYYFANFLYSFMISTIFVTSNPSPKSEFLCQSDLVNYNDGFRIALVLPLFPILPFCLEFWFVAAIISAALGVMSTFFISAFWCVISSIISYLSAWKICFVSK
jgi:hypothetical protein